MVQILPYVEPCKCVRICCMHDLIVQPLIKEKMFLFVSNAALFFVSYCLHRSRPGSNIICTAIHYALTRILETHFNGDGDAYIEELFVQVNNCVGENKNHILVGYLGSLLGRGIICRVENQFYNGGTRAHQDRSDRSIRSSQGQVFSTLLQRRAVARRSVCIRAEILFILKIYHPLQAPVNNRDLV